MIGWFRRRWGDGNGGATVPGPAALAEIEGYIRFHRLEDWWTEAFSDDERLRIARHFSALGAQPGRLLTSEVTNSESRFGFLGTLLAALDAPGFRTLADRVFDKARASVKPGTRTPDRHFLYQRYIEIATEGAGNSSEGFERMELACREMIQLAPDAARIFVDRGTALPRHPGYEVLGAWLERRGCFDEALALYRLAREQGWQGRWDAAISRCIAAGRR